MALYAVVPFVCSRTAETGGVAERMIGGVEDILNDTTATVDGAGKNQHLA